MSFISLGRTEHINLLFTMNEQPPETGNTSVMRLLTSVKNSDSGFKKASKNIQVGDMKMISLQDWSYFHLISVLMIKYVLQT